MTEVEQLAEMWRYREAGGNLVCGVCGAPHVALQIDGFSRRWCCISCGRPSAWFLISQGEVRLVGRMSVTRYEDVLVDRPAIDSV